MMMMMIESSFYVVVCVVGCVCKWVVSLMASLARTATGFYTERNSGVMTTPTRLQLDMTATVGTSGEFGHGGGET